MTEKKFTMKRAMSDSLYHILAAPAAEGLRFTGNVAPVTYGKSKRGGFKQNRRKALKARAVAREKARQK